MDNTDRETDNRQTRPGAVDVGVGPIVDAVLTADGRVLVFGWRGLVLSTWDVLAGKLLTPADDFTWPVAAVRFTPDSRELLAATEALAVLRADARTGRVVERTQVKLNGEQRADSVLSVHPSHMAAIALSPNAGLLAYTTHKRHLGMI